MNKLYVLIAFVGLLVIYVIYSYFKNKNSNNIENYDDEDDNEKDDNQKDIKDVNILNEDDYNFDDEDIQPNNISNKNKIIKDIYPYGKSYLINPRTGLNSFGCNCICHDKNQVVYHIAPCCGIKEKCGCPCHLGIDYMHNEKCCTNAVEKQ